MQVRGTPASGKTTLALLLAQHIHQQEPAVHTIYIPIWPLQDVEAIGGWQFYLRQKYGWVPGKKTVFIFDEAQTTYEDYSLWDEFIKNIQAYNDRFAIALASYGSPSSRIRIAGLPVVVGDWQRVTLHQINLDGLGSVGLFFSQTEFEDLVYKKFALARHYFDPSFLKVVFEVTGGHVGAINGFLGAIVDHDVRFFMMSDHIT